MSPGLTKAVYGFEILLALAGLVLLWRYAVSPRARAKATRSPLPPWDTDYTEFALFLAMAMLSSFVGVLTANTISRLLGLKGDIAAALTGAGGQLGLLVGIATTAWRSPSYRSQGAASARSILRSGAATFVITLPLLHGTARAWDVLLKLFGVTAEPQDLIRMFRDATTPLHLLTLITLAVVAAPVAEELVFRAGIFRFLRTRAPRALALLTPAVVFAALHVNWMTLEGLSSFAPLVVFAVLFSMAYERTGHIGTTIVAHALFNLNTIMLILCGLSA